MNTAKEQVKEFYSNLFLCLSDYNRVTPVWFTILRYRQRKRLLQSIMMRLPNAIIISRNVKIW